METEMLNKEKDIEELSTMNSSLTTENIHLGHELGKVRRDTEWLRSELGCRVSEMQKLRLQQIDATTDKARLQSKLRDAELRNEMLKRKLIDAANEIKRRRDLVLESDEFKQLKQDSDRIAQRSQETDKELENQKRLNLMDKQSHANERERLLRLQSEIELQMKHLNSETESRLDVLTKQADEDKRKMEEFRSEIRRLEMLVKQLENENHQLLNELNVEREINSRNEQKRHTPSK